jgi:hypothetical protein
MAGVVCVGSTLGRGNSAQEEHLTTVRGRVLNAVTKEPMARALVVMWQDNSAAFTDDRGQFESKISEKNDAENGAIGRRVVSRLIEARKPGFLQAQRMATVVYVTGSTSKEQTEVTIPLVPEALIVGRVEVPGSEGDVRIMCQLYRREMSEGRETWMLQRTFTTWVDGEFRFSELRAGTYKLNTLEQMDPDSRPEAQLYGYPPVYYQNTTDFSVASPIVVKAGETARANMTVARREYYSVKIAVANMPVGRGLQLMVYPLGHHSPGWSLGYNAGEGTIERILPDGNYTVEASTPGEEEMSGILNFSVKGRPLEGPTLNLIRDATVSVRVREEFRSGQSNLGSTGMPSGNLQEAGRLIANFSVNLTAIDELNEFRRNASSRVAEGSQGQELTIPNVPPGRYRVDVNSGIGYAASIQSGGKDLTHQPLVVGFGGGVSPIEVVLRDAGAEVDGTLEEGTSGTVSAVEAAEFSPVQTAWLLPVEEGGQPRNVPIWQGKFQIQQVAPGNYLVVAFEQPPQDLPYGSEEVVQELSSKGQMIHVQTGQKLNVSVKVIGSEGD